MTDRVLQITDGTTTVDFADGNGYQLYYDGWSPTVAARRTGMFGAGPYAEVVETMTIRVYADNVATCLTRLGALAALLDQAKRFSRGEAVDPVVIKYATRDGGYSANPLQALILGAPDGAAPVTSPGNFDYVGTTVEVKPVQIVFVRRGLWLAAEDSGNNMQTYPGDTPLTVTLTGSPIVPSPVRLEMDVDAHTTTTANGFICTTTAASRLIITNMGDDYTSVSKPSGGSFAAAAGTGSVGTNVLQLTPSVAGTYTMRKALSPDSAARVFAVLVCVKNNSSSISYDATIKAIVGSGGDSFVTVVGSKSKLSGSSSWKFYHLGFISVPRTPSQITVSFEPSETGSDKLEIDQMIVMAVDNVTDSIIEIINSTGWNEEDFVFGLWDRSTHYLDHRILTHLVPDIYTIEGLSDLMQVGYSSGNLYLNTAGVSFVFYVAATAGGYAYIYGSGSPTRMQVYAYRRKGYLSPL